MTSKGLEERIELLGEVSGFGNSALSGVTCDSNRSSSQRPPASLQMLRSNSHRRKGCPMYHREPTKAF